MKRRDFLVSAAASAMGGVGLGKAGLAQAPAAGRQGAAPSRGRGGRGMSPAAVPESKLARVSLMTGDFGDVTRLPNNRNPTPEQTLTVFDLPKMYVEVYGVHNIEYQHSHLTQAETDQAFVRELKARLDENKVQMTQINLEFGPQNISNPDAAMRQQAIDHTKQWIDLATQWSCPRVMINQSQATLNKATRANAVAAWKAMADYGRSKNVKVSAETRGLGGATKEELGMLPWEFLAGVIKDAGAYSNVDIGNVGATTQQGLDDAIKGLMPTSSGNMHIKSSPNWDIGATVRFTESLGYKGLYSIEVSTHPAVRIVYNTILANLA
jgi:sugar phosphate isomerase/epimerase